MIAYFRSDVVEENGILQPSCNLIGRQQMTAYSSDKSEVGIMADVTNEQKQSIIDSGAMLTTKQALIDIYAFPSNFPVCIPPMAP